MSELVRYIAQNLVDQPDQVCVDMREAEEDIGKVIGKQGRTAKAIRAIMAAAQTDDRRARLEIAEKAAAN